VVLVSDYDRDYVDKSHVFGTKKYPDALYRGEIKGMHGCR
jgi:hypothetical protein